MHLVEVPSSSCCFEGLMTFTWTEFISQVKAYYSFFEGNAGKQPVAWKEYYAQHK